MPLLTNTNYKDTVLKFPVLTLQNLKTLQTKYKRTECVILNRSLKGQPEYTKFCPDKPGWIDDVIIDAFLARVVNDGAHVALPSGALHTFLNTSGEAPFPTMTADQINIDWKNGNIKKVMAPINISNVHWSLAVFDLESKEYMCKWLTYTAAG